MGLGQEIGTCNGCGSVVHDGIDHVCDRTILIETKEKLRIATESLAIAREALEFYGDIENWEVKTMSEGMLGETLIREVRQLEYNPGQRARAALGKIKGE